MMENWEEKIHTMITEIALTEEEQFVDLQVINLVQASLGLISNEIESIGLEWTGENINLYFHILNRKSETLEIIDDIQSEFESLQMFGVPINKIIIENEKFDFNYNKKMIRIIYNKKSG